MAFIIRHGTHHHTSRQHPDNRPNDPGLQRLSAPVQAFSIAAESVMEAAAHPNVTAGAPHHQAGRRGGDTISLAEVRRAALEENRQAMHMGHSTMIPSMVRQKSLLDHPLETRVAPTLHHH